MFSRLFCGPARHPAAPWTSMTTKSAWCGVAKCYAGSEESIFATSASGEVAHVESWLFPSVGQRSRAGFGVALGCLRACQSTNKSRRRLSVGWMVRASSRLFAPYFAHAPAKNKYRSRNSSLCAADVVSRNITCHSSPAEYTGHFGNPGLFGSPLRAKFAQYFCIVSLS